MNHNHNLVLGFIGYSGDPENVVIECRDCKERIRKSRNDKEMIDIILEAKANGTFMSPSVARMCDNILKRIK